MTPTPSTSLRPGRLPAGVIPGPVTLPTPDRPRGRATPAPSPAARPTTRTPSDIIKDLATQLQTLGIPATTMYTAASHNRALLSLPQTTIWATSHTLTWTHHGQPVTWPAQDITGAAARLAQLTHQPSPAGTPVQPGSPVLARHPAGVARPTGPGPTARTLPPTPTRTGRVSPTPAATLGALCHEPLSHHDQPHKVAARPGEPCPC